MSLWIKLKMKASEQYFPVVPFVPHFLRFELKFVNLVLERSLVLSNMCMLLNCLGGCSVVSHAKFASYIVHQKWQGMLSFLFAL